MAPADPDSYNVADLLETQEISEKPHTLHDAFVKYSLHDLRVLSDFLQQYLPDELVHCIQWDTLALCQESFSTPSLGEKRVDVLCTVMVLYQSVQYVLYLHIEHQRTIDSLMPHRLHYYESCIREYALRTHRESPFPMVFCMVLYNGNRPYTGPRSIPEMYGGAGLALLPLASQFPMLDVTCIADWILLAHAWNGIMTMALKHSNTKERERVLVLLNNAIETVVREGGEQYVDKALLYLSLCGGFHRRREKIATIINLLGPYLTNYLKEHIMDAAKTAEMEFDEAASQFIRDEAFQYVTEKLIKEGLEKGIKQGIKQGIEQGIEQGRQEERRLIVQRLLTDRFGTIPRRYQQRIERANVDALLAFVPKIYAAATLEQVFRDA